MEAALGHVYGNFFAFFVDIRAKENNAATQQVIEHDATEKMTLFDRSHFAD